MNTAVYFYRSVAYQYYENLLHTYFTSWSIKWNSLPDSTNVWRFNTHFPSCLRLGEAILREFSDNSKIKKWEI